MKPLVRAKAKQPDKISNTLKSTKVRTSPQMYKPLAYVIEICVISGLASGLIFGITRIIDGPLIFDGVVHAGTDPVQFGASWFPGLIFEILFSRVFRWDGAMTLSYASVSSIAYYFAVRIASTIFMSKGSNALHMYYVLAIAGSLSGGFGALVLTLATRIFEDKKYGFFHEMFTMALGGFTGWIFLTIFWDSYEGMWFSRGSVADIVHEIFMYCVMFVMWQLVVGVRLYSVMLVAVNNDVYTKRFNQRLNEFLTGPIVQLIGLIGSVLAIIGLFSKVK